MSTIKDIVYSIASSAPGLTALVGTRIYPVVAPESVISPYIVFKESNYDSEISATMGTGGTGTGPFLSTIQFVIAYEDEKQGVNCAAVVDSIAAQVKAAFNDYHGTVGGVNVQLAFITSAVDGFDPETNSFYKVLTFNIWHDAQ